MNDKEETKSKEEANKRKERSPDEGEGRENKRGREYKKEMEKIFGRKDRVGRSPIREREKREDSQIKSWTYTRCLK